MTVQEFYDWCKRKGLVDARMEICIDGAYFGDGVSRMDKKTITDALKHCADETNTCIKCPYNKRGSAQCIPDLMRDALALIGVLETNGEE